MAIDDFRTQAEAMRGLLGDVGVTDDDYRRAAKAKYDKAAAIEAPQHYASAMRDEMGLGKFMGKAFFGEMAGPLAAMFAPDYLDRKNQYKADLLSYADQRTEEMARARMQGDITMLNNGIDEPEDAFARANMLGMPGIGSPEDVGWVLKGGQPKVTPDYVTVENNGQKYMVDKKNPHSPGIPLTTPDGKPIRSSLQQWQVDNIGAFDRMVPRLQELDEMERMGMAIPRSTMTQLRAYEKMDSSGQNVILASGFGEWMTKYLTPEQRKYILAAEDAGMVVLRDESGAAISSDEILRQMNQYLMFDDLDGPTRSAQRGSRTRKAGTLMTGMPDYIKSDRKGQLDWVTNFDPSISVEGVNPAMTTGGGELPPMTAANMATYLKLLKRDPKLGAQFIELIGGAE